MIDSPYQETFRHKGERREDLKAKVADVEKRLKGDWGVDPVRKSRFIDSGDNVVFIWSKP